jgi:hypothetical protein
MAQGGSGRTGGKARPAGRGPAGARTTSSGKGANTGRGSGGGKGPNAGRGSSGGRGAGGRNNQSAVSAQRAIKGARGRSGAILRVGIPILVVIVVAAVVVVGVLLSNNKKVAAGQQNPANADSSAQLLASTAHQHTGDAVSGVQSNDNEQVLFHVHAHLTIYVNGKQKLLPYGVGIVPPYQLQQTADGPFVAGGSKFYWLHTHDESGVIHIESPVQRTFTLGDFFAVWNQPLNANQAGPSKGKITAFLNGKKFTGNPATIPLAAHGQIQLDVGTVVPFKQYTFAQGL